MSEFAIANKGKNYTNGLLGELERLVDAGETGDFSIALDGGGLPGEEAEAVRLLNEAVKKYKASVEYDLMKYKLANDALSIALWDVDVVNADPVNPQNKFRWSQEYRHMLGFSDERDFPNVLQSWSELLHPEDKERTINAFAAHLNDRTGKTPYDIEYRLMLKNGDYRYFHAFGTTLRDSAGAPLRAAGAMMDITAKKQMERDIAEANERLHLMLDSSPLCCTLWNRNSGLIDCNEAAVKLYGLKDKQEYKERFFELSPECQPDGRRSDETIVTLVKETFAEGGGTFNWLHKMLDGTPMPSEVTLVRVRYADDYVVVGYMRDLREHNKMMRDIAYRDNLLYSVNHAAAFLLNSDIESFRNALYQSMRFMAKAVRVDRMYIWKNYTADGRLHCVQVYEWSEGAEPRQEKEFTPGISYCDKLPGWEKILSNGKCINELVRNMSREEQAHLSPQCAVSILVVPIFMKGQFWGFVGFDDCHGERIFTKEEESILRSGSLLVANALSRNEMMLNLRDTSIQLASALEQTTAASKAKSDFLVKMSHEIRTPMNAIIGMTELALRENEPETKNEHISITKQASLNLLSIMNDILDVSKIETGKLEIVPADYSVSSLINDVVSIIRMRAIDSQIRFAVNIDSNIPKTLVGDETRICHALLNILSNSVKYTEKGFVSFTAYAEFVDENTMNLVMKVMDSSKGIKREDIERLFDDFTQFDFDKNENIEGVGLGLAIAYSIVNAMGGGISIQSEYGKGSTFTITLPQKYYSREAMAAVENPDGKSVLLYDRREIYADSIVYTVENLGVKCTLVKSDSELHEKLSDRVYDFLFISFELFKENKDIISEFWNKAKIVVLTEFGEAIPDKNLNVLAMPAHPVSIANVLNGASANFSYDNNNEFTVMFTAPDVKVLIVDDVVTNLKVAQGLLLPYKMQVVLCKNGMTAIKTIQSKDYDLVFMDHKMPEMDGVETTRRIRALGIEDPYYKNVPIVALTANAVSGTKEMFLENGFDDFLSKPIDTGELNAILEKWIPKSKQDGITA